MSCIHVWLAIQVIADVLKKNNLATNVDDHQLVLATVEQKKRRSSVSFMLGSRDKDEQIILLTQRPLAYLHNMLKENKMYVRNRTPSSIIGMTVYSLKTWISFSGPNSFVALTNFCSFKIKPVKSKQSRSSKSAVISF
jgi:hypothetical protein